MFLKMSLSGGLLIILVIILRHILNNHIPKRIFMFLWYIAALRLIVPVWLPFKYGILLPVFQETGSNTAGSGIPFNSSHTFSQMKIQHITAAPATRKALDINLPFVIWITGAIISLTILILLYIKEYRIIREALPLPYKDTANLRKFIKIPERIGILISDRITTPLAAGIIHPKIIFPKFFKPDSILSLKYIITHELIHIRRADNLWKIIILSTVCLHWFNPLVWVMYILFNRDLEISCDEKVISVFGNGAKKDYALALVNFAEKQYKWQFFSNGFGKKPVQERIEAIMNYKKLTVPGAICAAILLGAAVTVFAKGSTQGNKSKITVIQENINKTEASKKESPAGNNSAGESNSQEGTWTTNNLKYFASTEDFKEYEKFGLSYNADTCHLMYNGKIVGYFHDETSKNVFTHFIDEAGKIGIKVKRNSDNKITGFEDFEFEFVTTSYDAIKEGTEPESDTAIEENDIYISYTIKGEEGSASSSSDEDNSSFAEKYKKYGITYDKSSDILQYKGKNIAGLIIYNKPESSDTGKDKAKGFTAASETEIYTNSEAGKNGAYFIIDENGTVKETTKKEFKKILEG